MGRTYQENNKCRGSTFLYLSYQFFNYIFFLSAFLSISLSSIYYSYFVIRFYIPPNYFLILFFIIIIMTFFLTFFSISSSFFLSLSFSFFLLSCSHSCCFRLSFLVIFVFSHSATHILSPSYHLTLSQHPFPLPFLWTRSLYLAGRRARGDQVRDKH